MKWERITDLSKYIETEDVQDPKEMDYSLSSRYYKQAGKKSYPLLHIGIHANSSYVVGHYNRATKSVKKGELTGIKIGSSFKKKEGDWWEKSDENAYIPPQLFSDLMEMLEEAKTNLATK